MKIILAAGALAFLAACGIKGDPEPVAAKPKTGITLSGTAGIGVTYRKES